MVRINEINFFSLIPNEWYLSLGISKKLRLRICDGFGYMGIFILSRFFSFLDDHLWALPAGYKFACSIMVISSDSPISFLSHPSFPVALRRPGCARPRLRSAGALGHSRDDAILETPSATPSERVPREFTGALLLWFLKGPHSWMVD